MWLKKITAIFFVVFTSNNVYSQQVAGNDFGGGKYDVRIKEEITPAMRQAIIQKLQYNENRLRQEGKLPVVLSTNAQAFSWPIKQALNYNDPGFYGISNYVDENTNYPNLVTDYNCGNRSYDLNSGYNHAGTDIFTWPFWWDKMDNNKVQVVAAAPGTIIGKDDGNYDQNCSFCTAACNWNAVYIQHSDGSVAWYGHLKAASLTTKNIGSTVSEGEYLGIVGSSGNSTGPHLHLEVYTNSSYTQLVDPWAGACNTLNGNTSWWANQQPYYVPTLNKIMTGFSTPVFSQCPGGEVSNQKINFVSGETVYFSSYYRDQRNNEQTQHTIYKPDNSVYLTWTFTLTGEYITSYWWHSRSLPFNAEPGIWKYEVQYGTRQKESIYFNVNGGQLPVCPNNNNTLFANISGATYQWQVDTGSGFVNISNGTNYNGVTTQQLQLLNTPSSFYNYKYRCVANASQYSAELRLKFTSYWLGTKSNRWEDPANWSCGNVPDANTDVVVNSGTPNMPVVSSQAFCRSTSLLNASSIRVNTGFNLTVTGK